MNSCKFICLVVLYLLATRVSAQQGCTDSQASNYDPTAWINDGSCSYSTTNLSLSFKCDINPALLAETSGIVKNGNSYWTHVDNSDNAIYRIDTLSDTIFQKITILNAVNQDWEDIASDNNYIYVGDIGNNGGNRTNLRFYKIPKSSINNSCTTVTAGKIKFSYSDQVIFNLNHGSYYDCEAFFVLNGSIHMFTKGWTNKWTKHYVLSTDTGIQVAQLVDSFNVNGQITSAAIQGDSLVVLLGLTYSGGYESFIWAFSDFSGTNFFSGNKRRFEIGTINTVGQLEAICFSGKNKGYITNEKLSGRPPVIREFDLNPYVPESPTVTTSVTTHSVETGFRIYPNPFAENASIDYSLDKFSFVTVEVFNAIGKKVETLVQSEKQTSGSYSYKMKGSAPGIYIVRLTIDNETFVERIVKS